MAEAGPLDTYVESAALSVGAYTDEIFIPAGIDFSVTVDGAATGLKVQRCELKSDGQKGPYVTVRTWESGGEPRADMEPTGAWWRAGGASAGTPRVRISKRFGLGV